MADASTDFRLDDLLKSQSADMRLEDVAKSAPQDMRLEDVAKQGALPGGAPASGTAVLDMHPDAAPYWEQQANDYISRIEAKHGPMTDESKQNVLSTLRAQSQGAYANPATPSLQQTGQQTAEGNSALANFGAPIVQGEVQAGELFKHPFDAAARNQEIQQVAAQTQTTPGSIAAKLGQVANTGMQMAPMMVPGAGMAYGAAQAIGNVANQSQISGAGPGATALDMGLQAGTMALMGPMARSLGGVAAPMVEDMAAGILGSAGAGGITQVANNISDAQTGVDPNRAITEGVLPAVLGGGIAHGITQLTGGHAPAPQPTFEGQPVKMEQPNAYDPSVVKRMIETGKKFNTETPPSTAKPVDESMFHGAKFEPVAQADEATTQRIAGAVPEAQPQNRAAETAGTLKTDQQNADYGRRAADWNDLSPDQKSEQTLLGKLRERASGFAGNEAGGENAAQKFVEQDVKPGVEALGSGIKDTLTGIHQLFGSPIKEAAGPQAEVTKGLMRERGAELAQRFDQLESKFGDAQKALDKLPVDQQRQITDDAERGQPQRDPKMQPLADALRSQYDDRLAQIKQRDPEFKGLEDYMGHAYEQPDRASSVMAEMMANKPLAGNKSFRKGRTIPYQSEAIDAGLKPVTDNPVEMMRMKVAGMDKWITAHDLGKDLTTRGIVKDLPANGKAPEGHTALTDPQFRGKMAPDEVANVFNNALSPGLASNKYFGTTYRTVRAVGNTLNQASLGLSGMHVLTSTINSAVSDFALGLKQAIGGDIGGGLKSMARGASGTSAFRDAWQGTQIGKEWDNPGSTTPETAQIVQAMKAAGGRNRMDSSYSTGATEKMMQAFRGGNIIGGALRAPMAAVETVAKPIMESLVPNLKKGAFMQMAKAELAKNPNMSSDEMRTRMGNAWDSVDNRFGEMVHDNLFWNKTMHDLAMISTRSIGWNLGTAREGVGAVKDLATLPSRVAAGGEGMTHRMAYAVALPTLVGLWGSVAHYMMTGTPPATVKDMFHPATGEKDKNGDPIRIQLPTYMKDIFSVAHSPGSAIAGKVHPLLGAAIDLMNNRDFLNHQIADDHDSFLQRQLDRIEYVAKAGTPISASNAAKPGQSTTDQFAGVMGVNRTPAYINRTDAENAAEDLMPQTPALDRDQVAKNAARTTTKRPGLSGMLGRSELSAADIMGKVWPKMTPAERQQNMPLIRQRIAAAQVPFMQRQAMYTQIRENQ